MTSIQTQYETEATFALYGLSEALLSSGCMQVIRRCSEVAVSDPQEGTDEIRPEQVVAVLSIFGRLTSQAKEKDWLTVVVKRLFMLSLRYRSLGIDVQVTTSKQFLLAKESEEDNIQVVFGYAVEIESRLDALQSFVVALQEEMNTAGTSFMKTVLERGRTQKVATPTPSSTNGIHVQSPQPSPSVEATPAQDVSGSVAPIPKAQSPEIYRGTTEASPRGYVEQTAWGVDDPALLNRVELNQNDTLIISRPLVGYDVRAKDRNVPRMIPSEHSILTRSPYRVGRGVGKLG